jgi:hypothetical protein
MPRVTLRPIFAPPILVAGRSIVPGPPGLAASRGIDEAVGPVCIAGTSRAAAAWQVRACAGAQRPSINELANMEGTKLVKSSEFAEAIIEHMD